MRIRHWLGVLAVAAVALAGCSGPGGSGAADGGPGQAGTTATGSKPGPDKAPAEAARRTFAAGTARGWLKTVTTVEGLAPSTMTGSGTIDFRRKCSQMNITIDSSGRKLTVLVIYDGAMVYEKLPPEMVGASTRPWIKLDLSKLLGSGAGDGQFGANDPGSVIAYLYGTDKITEVGSEPVRGTPTTHYKGSIDPKRAAEQVPPESRDEYLKFLQETGSGEIMPADLWVDEQGLIRRLQFQGEATVQGRHSASTTTIEYYDYGSPVTIQLPPPSEIR